MSYQALARKWRPRNFAELSGQEHVVRALSNALTRNRLHHAYLLTGTRGVGKTTIARILAKSLNCDTGITATPCGVCAACMEIDAGRFVDLLELDAASNTGIDNMREILDNARYAPTAGRYKVYLIDEVHMLSKAAFNSMLKTLEEPPEHVKFVLATTDPQKIPVTVLSRCLQFNLKQLPATEIKARLGSIMAAENIATDDGALALIARGAQGSMRDGLSLLDQAIAYGGGEVREDMVRNMLGAIDTEHVFRLLDALLDRDGKAMLAEADAMATRNLSSAAALEALASLFHAMAVAQVIPGAGDALDEGARVAHYASRMSPEEVQLAYQICVQGRSDLALAPDEAMGFSMTLLRLLAFEPGSGADLSAPPPGTGTASVALQSGTPLPAFQSRTGSAALQSGTESTAFQSQRNVPEPQGDALESQGNIPEPQRDSPEPGHDAPKTQPSAPSSMLPASPDAWIALIGTLKLSGMAGQLAAQTEWRRCDGREIVLAVPEPQRHLTERAYTDKLRVAVEGAMGQKVRLAFEYTAAGDASLAAQERRDRALKKAQTEATFCEEPFVRDVLARFDARIKPDSIKPAS